MKKIVNSKNYISTNNNLMKEWNFKRNIGKDPTKIVINSSKIVWWVCKNGHEWQESVKSRTKGTKCPGCFGKRIIKGFNDLATVKPNLAKEWNYKKNKGLKPDNISCCSNQRVWWICEKGHEWNAVISSRFYGSKCPFCTNRKILVGFNDLKTLNPKLASEWNYSKNLELKPEKFTLNSNKKVWWICKHGHEWEADISARSRGNGCPYCAGHKAISGKNDIKTKCPELLKEWDYIKNIDIKPEKLSYKSHKKVWWLCSKGHSWQSAISARANGNGCPICANKTIIRGINDLATVNPKLASEWNYEKNGILTPFDVGSGSNTQVWWKCSKGHEFKGVINSRNSKKTGCPICSNKIIIPGVNDLKTTNPKLASEWNYKRNKGLRPTKVSSDSNKIVWWKCWLDHEWLCSINDRNLGHGCPICKGKRFKKINDVL